MPKLALRAEEMELTDAISDAIEKKMANLDKYLANLGTPQELRIVVGKTTQRQNKGNIFKAEADLVIPGHTIHAEVVGEDLYAAVDTLKDELKNLLTKTVKTEIGLHRAGAREAKENGTETELV